MDLACGVEGVRQGNDESEAYQAGAFVEFGLAAARTSLGLHGGYKESWSPGLPHDHDGYLGASLYRRF